MPSTHDNRVLYRPRRAYYPRGEEADVTIVITASPKNENPTTWLLTPGTTIFTNATGDRKLAPRSKTLASVTLVQEITFIDEFDDISVNRFTIEPGGDRTITFTFRPSKDTPVGTYNFTYHLETLDLEPSYWCTIDSIKIHVI